jgi:poly-gamma-glutamate capsule biosynthesis protein CapA/YwtB (metallophosphatase superfamily)
LRAARESKLADLSFTVTAVGDIMLGSNYPATRLPQNDGRDLLASVSPWMADADVAFGNLEGVLASRAEPAKKCENPAACYLFRSPPHYAETLAEAGFTAISVANNHARDFGEDGRAETMTALDRAGIVHSGAEGDVAVWNKRGVRFALIAFSPTRGSHNLLDIDFAAGLVATHAANSDVVIVSIHAGAEGANSEHVPFREEIYYDESRGDSVTFAHAVIDAGADMVIGHGPHVPRALEIYKERIVAYSLGNFATWYGISVAGSKSLAPMLKIRIDGNGRFLQGDILSARQVRPGGPVPDSTQGARRMMQKLTIEDFAGGGLVFDASGSFYPLWARRLSAGGITSR